MKRNMVLALAVFAALACSKKKDNDLTIPLEAVSRQTIIVDAQATGVVEPINVIEVKAKSSGQIVAMPVETGTLLRPGDLIVQLDTRDTRNSYSQAKADLDAALIKLTVSRRGRDRAAELFKERIITSTENEAAQVDYANSQATVLRNRAALDLRAQSLEEATVRAPVGGTVIEKTVSLGQVIASGTGSFGAGTTILKMADLSKVRVRALVNETDIGKVRPGLSAVVTVDAFPDRPFNGVVEKIEPQATIQQSVTMFPVLISIDNTLGLLMPGMNGEISIEVERKDNVLAVSNDAIRNPNEIVSVATLLGLNPDSVRAQLSTSSGGGTAGATGRLASNGGGGQGAASGDAQSGDAGATRRRGAGGGPQGGGQGGQGQAGRQGGVAGQDGQSGQSGQSAQSGQSGQAGSAMGGASGGRSRRGMVFTVKDGKYTPKVVRLGVSNYDYSEVIDGVEEGEQVAILNVAAMQARQQTELELARGRAGVPGMQRQPTQTQGGAGGPGGAGGGAGGAGGRPGGGGGF